ncbi:MAG: SsrA-binding protein [Archangium gephyra]|uniref:SsrA-binding protein n=1 Tax=Archangium gephyra TaxID=48 RepID=A0A2W5V6P7_9BACT|nr:MAG: SsrA-binding protein [Archangium gephyra]
MAPKRDNGTRLICENRRARFDYVIDDTLEAGIALMGSEVKALRIGEASLSDSYALPERNELFLHNAHIGAYKPASQFGHLPIRPRKLLIHRAEFDRWAAKVKERGYSIIPLELYFKEGRAKVKLGLAKGKTGLDRRDTIKDREAKREMDRAMRRR